MSKSKILYKIALYLGVVPFLVGILVTFSWLLTRNKLLEEACVWMLVIGMWSLGIGVLVLIAYIIVAKKRKDKHILKNSLKVIFSYLAETVVTIILLLYAIYLLTISSVTFVNESDYRVSRIVLKNGDKRYLVQDLAPHSQETKSLDFDRDGELEYSLQVDEVNKSGILFGYVCSSIGLKGRITIHSDKTISAVEFHDEGKKEFDFNMPINHDKTLNRKDVFKF